MFRDYLVEEGFEVGIARSGEAALQDLGQTSYELVVLDVMMPGIGGTETLRRVSPSSNGFPLTVAPIVVGDLCIKPARNITCWRCWQKMPGTLSVRQFCQKKRLADR